MKKTTRVLMVEDNEADAELILAELHRSSPGVVARRVDSREAFSTALREFAPDIVLCDHSVASFDAHAAMDVLRAVLPAVPLIVVTGAADERLTIDWLRSGVEDVLLKTHLSRLPAAIDAALAIRQRLHGLTPRQLQVLRLIAEGHSTPEVARRLRLSAKTVETHRTELMKRVGIHDVVRLVRFAVRVGLVSSDV
jgi:DNA-binding NarL/FixJ family response regulator